MFIMHPNLSIYLSIFIDQFNHVSIYSFIHPTNSLSFHLSNNPSIYPYILQILISIRTLVIYQHLVSMTLIVFISCYPRIDDMNLFPVERGIVFSNKNNICNYDGCQTCEGCYYNVYIRAAFNIKCMPFRG